MSYQPSGVLSTYCISMPQAGVILLVLTYDAFATRSRLPPMHIPASDWEHRAGRTPMQCPDASQPYCNTLRPRALLLSALEHSGRQAGRSNRLGSQHSPHLEEGVLMPSWAATLDWARDAGARAPRLMPNSPPSSTNHQTLTR